MDAKSYSLLHIQLCGVTSTARCDRSHRAMAARTARAHTARARAQPEHTQHGHVDGRRPHEVDERYTSAPHDQHECAQPEHAQHGHVQQAGARARTTPTTNRTSTPRTQHGHTGVRSAKRTGAGSAVPRPCLRSLAAVGLRHLPTCATWAPCVWRWPGAWPWRNAPRARPATPTPCT